MNKLKLGFLILVISIIFISCSNTKPNISFKLMPGNDTVEINSEYNDPGAEALINGEIFNSGEYESYEIVENTVDTSQVGIYYINYELSYRNTVYYLLRVVTVVDEIPPEITLNPGVDTVKIGEEWVDGYVKTEDNSFQEVNVIIDGEVDNLTPGEYSITYIATDIYGNESEITRIVNVVQ